MQLFNRSVRKYDKVDYNGRRRNPDGWQHLLQ